MPFDNLPKQTPINMRADAYIDAALRLSRYAAFTTRCVLDVRYGDLPDHRLDIYMPADKSLTNLPVFINIHGGGWTHGYKEMLGLNAPVIVAFPAIYISVEYRLAPQAKHPAQVEDCARALAWTYKNITGYGGDPGRIHLGGHSAGANMAALIVLQPKYRQAFGLPDNVVKSCFPYCGIFDLRDMHVYGQTQASNPANDFLAKVEDAEDASPMAWAHANKTPFFVAWGENDGALIKAEASAFIVALEGSGARVQGLQLAGFDHFWTHLDQARAVNPWTRTLKSWILGDPHTAPIFETYPA